MVPNSLSRDGDEMFSEECVLTALNDLVRYHEFEIQEIRYSEEYFGNFVVNLVKRDFFKVRFLRDRGQMWCELGLDSDWMQLEDVLEVVGVRFEYDHNDDYYRNIKLVSGAIHCNFALLDKALGEDTIKRVELIKQKRVEELLKGFR